MPDDLQSAAERYRRDLNGEDRDEVWPESQYEEYWMPEQKFDDMLLLAKAYLAARPADDGEVVTRDWLMQFGPESEPREDGSTAFMLFGKHPNGSMAVVAAIGTDGDFEIEGRTEPGFIKTRGDVRRLMEALGIETKEQANG